MSHKTIRLTYTWLILSVASWAHADTVFTTDGSRLVGTIEKWADGKLVLVTEFAGKLEMDSGKIKAVETGGPFNVQFDSGDRLVGPIAVGADEAGSVIHAAVGSVPVAPDRVVAGWPVGTESPEVAAVRAETAKTAEALKPKWNARLEAGGAMTDGNTDTLEGRGRFDVKRKTSDDLLHLYLAAKYAEQNDARTTNEYKGGILYENQISERWYWYTRLELEHDEFERLDLRATAAAGAGYYWLKKAEHELKTRLGFGYRHESFDDGITKNSAVTDLGLDYRVDVTPWLQFTHSTTYSPDIEEFNDYRLFLDTALVFPFENKSVKLKLGMTNDYNSRPERGIERLDNTYYANLVFDIVNQ